MEKIISVPHSDNKEKNVFIFFSLLLVSHLWLQDYVTIYDGYTTRDPIILKFCGGGQAVPASISSGPELLVEFTTSPYGTFLTSQQRNINTLYGFQLEVVCCPFRNNIDRMDAKKTTE
jgi:CUB domain